MRQQICLMPVKCVKCDALFDLRYDYSGAEAAEKDEAKPNKLLCWDCRANSRKKK